MSLLQSALDFLAGPGTLGAASRDQNDFVGQTVEMGEMKLRIRRIIAEGKPGTRWRRPGGAALRCAAGGLPAGRCPQLRGQPRAGGARQRLAGAGAAGAVVSSCLVEPAPCHGTGLKAQDLSWEGRTGISTVDSALYPPRIQPYERCPNAP